MTYSYDALARLQYATAGPVATPTWKLGFVYDRYGNRTQQNLLAGTGFATQTPTNPVTNRLARPNVYDASGNLTNDTLHTYTYDAENRMTTVDSTAAVYTYSGPLRVKEVVPGATVVRIYSGSKLIAYYVNGALAGEYVYAGGTLLAGLDANGNRLYRHPDHLTQRVLTDQGGGVQWTGGHYPFGESWYQPVGNTDQRFTSYVRDFASGLDYAIFRNYSTRLGRFMQEDPLAGYIEDPQSLNSYAYVLNDPSNLTDPLGLSSFTVCVTIHGNDWGCADGADWWMWFPIPIPGFPDVGGGGGGGGGDSFVSSTQQAPDLTANLEVLRILYCLLKKAGWGRFNTERSTWLTQDKNGNYGSRDWDWSAEQGEETWKGDLPEGTVANAHTHNNSIPKPSTWSKNPLNPNGDHGTADKIKKPVYTVTLSAIWKANPGSKVPQQVQGTDWTKPFEKQEKQKQKVCPEDKKK